MPVRTEYYQGATKTSPFYGEPTALAQLAGQSVDRLQTRDLPPGWLVQTWSGWEGWTPRDWQPRVQGWKIHVSATPGCAEQTLARTTGVCVDRDVAFKFLPTLAELTESSSKQGHRGSAGKFITIYPDSDDQLAELLITLAAELDGQDGPYILSDLRFSDDAPIFVRYGAILGMEVPDVDDEPVDSIVDPRTMGLLPDQRGPRFALPEGIELPGILQAAYQTSQESCASRLDDFTTIQPLHFSNAGGVYRAELPDGQVRVLREARPHAGLDARNRCALQRQLIEEQVLRDLSGVAGVQQLRGSFTAWEHRFLELDYVEGTTLTSWVVRNSTVQESDPADYASQAQAIVAQMVSVVEAIHRRGWALGDLHPGNILVSQDGVVTILDLEDATRLDSPREIGFRVFEYCADDSADAEQADWFAVARSIMLIYCSDFEIEAVSPAFWDRCRREIRRVYGERVTAQLADVERRYPAQARPVLASDVTVGVPQQPLNLDTAIPGLMRGIEWSRRFAPHGAYPGDIAAPDPQAHEVLGSGRAGVVLAQHRVGGAPASRDVDALVRVARDWRGQDSPGLLNGLAGIALVLSELAQHEDAVAAAGRALDWSLARRRLDLSGGQAGTILAAVEVATAAKDADLADRALAAYHRLHHTVTPQSSAWTALCRRRGLFWGLTGLALTDLVAHAATGDREPLARARDRVRADLDACVTLPSGEVMINDTQNNRVLPYTEWGSAGLLLIGSALERLSGAVLLNPIERAGIVTACSSDFYIYPGLDHGRAGIAMALAAAGEAHRAEADRQVGLVLGSLLAQDEHVLAIGDGLIRLSSDLSTGAAGIALALHAHRLRQPYLPLPISRRTIELLHKHPMPPTPDPDSDSHDLAIMPSPQLVA